MKVRIDHLDANPFRHIERYPIREDKIRGLTESIETTGFWDNLVGRQVGDRVQIAYGHHRREALRRAYPDGHEVGIVVRDFDDDHMLKIMARENMEEWGSSALVEHETVRAVVEAHGSGRIELPEAKGNARYFRYAPSFVQGEDSRGPGRASPYTATTVAEFLGWVEVPSEKTRLARIERGDPNPDRVGPQEKVENALAALAYIEQGHLAESDFEGLGTKAAEALVEETRRSVIAAERVEAEAKRRAEQQEQLRQQAAERAAKAEQERAAALERAKAVQDEYGRDRAEQEYRQRQEAAEQAVRERKAADQRAEHQRKEDDRARAARETERRKVSDAVGQSMRSGGGYKNARQVADKVRGESKSATDPVQIDDYAQRIGGRVHRLLDEEYDKDLGDALNDLIKHRQHLSPAAAQNLARELSALAARATSLRDRLTYTPTDSPDLDVIEAEVVHDSTEA